MAQTDQRSSPSTAVFDETYTVVDTPLGPMGVVESAAGLLGVIVGETDARAVELRLRSRHPRARAMRQSPLAERLAAYARGVPDPFSDVPLVVAGFSPFRVAVTEACRAIAYGQTVSYRDLALSVGAPAASRAVGAVMASNPWPIVVPCHRVLRTDGSLGGYSARLGLRFKQQLLELEQAAPPWGRRPRQERRRAAELLVK